MFSNLEIIKRNETGKLKISNFWSMKKVKKSKSKKRSEKNPVAKYLNKFNKAATHRDRTKFNKKRKHKGKGYDLSRSV